LWQYKQQAMAQEEETPASTPPSNNTAGSQSTESNDYLTYENSTYRIKISYPSTWKVVNVSNANDSRFIKIIAFDSPDENAGIGVWTDDSPGNETIDTYLAEDIQNYRQNPDYPNFTLISSDTKNTMFAGIPGYELLFSYANNYTTGLSKEIGTILGDKACSVVYDSVLSQYSINEPVLNPMIDSLVINVPKSNQTRIFNRTGGNATASQRSSTSEIIPEI
jgi:eukaryotic-like serine/threonine-protein kinase